MMHEDKKAIVAGFINVLKQTRAGSDIEGFKYDKDAEIVIIKYENGEICKLSIAGDSGIAIIQDILKAF